MMIARTGAELWYELIEAAGLQPETSYDRDIVDQIGRALKLRWGSDLGAEIERSGRDATAVFVAVLGALQPWAQMMRDLLELMAASSATRTRTQLRADVDVGAASAQLELDLNDFTEAVEAFEELETEVAVREWSIADLEALWSLLPYPDEDERARLRVEVREWLQAYRPAVSDETAPALSWPPPPPPPRSENDGLDRALAAAWSVWEDLLRRVASNSASHRDLLRKGQEAQAVDTSPDSDPILAWLTRAETDYFLGSIAAGLDEVARRARAGDWSPWGNWDPKHEPQDLIDLVERISPSGKGTEIVRRAQALLSLPVWKHRYDLYSNWVFTRIVAALREAIELRVEHTEGRIDFGFAEARMATSDAHDLVVYCELRSPLVGKSPKRKHQVQPDYSILIGGAGDPAALSVVEVECKQYKSASRENFATALQDYARSRPRAMVVLANYGPVSERVREGILGSVDGAVRDRCQVIGEMRPPAAADDHETSRRQFALAVQQAVGIEPPPLRLALPEEPAQIELFWSEPSGPVDLDLHLEIDDGLGSVVSFERPAAGEPAHVRLLADVRHGPGPETLVIERWVGSTYRLWVHRYREGELGECEPVVVFSCGELHRSFECPSGDGPWWCVLEIGGTSRELSAVESRDSPAGGHRM